MTPLTPFTKTGTRSNEQRDKRPLNAPHDWARSGSGSGRKYQQKSSQSTVVAGPTTPEASGLAASSQQRYATSSSSSSQRISQALSPSSRQTILTTPARVSANLDPKLAAEDAWTLSATRAFRYVDTIESLLTSRDYIQATEEYREAVQRLHRLSPKRGSGNREMLQSTTSTDSLGRSRESLAETQVDKDAADDKTVVEKWLRGDNDRQRSSEPSPRSLSESNQETVDDASRLEQQSPTTTADDLLHVIEQANLRLQEIARSPSQAEESKTLGADGAAPLEEVTGEDTGLHSNAYSTHQLEERPTKYFMSSLSSHHARPKTQEGTRSAALITPQSLSPKPSSPLHKRPQTGVPHPSYSSRALTIPGLDFTKIPSTRLSSADPATMPFRITFREPLSHQAARFRAERWKVLASKSSQSRTSTSTPVSPQRQGPVESLSQSSPTGSDHADLMASTYALADPVFKLEEAYRNFAPTATHNWPRREPLRKRTGKR